MSEINEPKLKNERMDEDNNNYKMKEMIKEVLLNNKDYYKPLFEEILIEVITEGNEKAIEYLKSHNVNCMSFNRNIRVINDFKKFENDLKSKYESDENKINMF